MDQPQYYSGSLDNCDWSEDEYGLDKSVLLDQQYPGNFIDIGIDGTQETLQAIVGAGSGGVQTNQTIFIRFRKIETTNQHSVYGNEVNDPAKINTRFIINIPRPGPVLNQVTFRWGTGNVAFVLPANIDYVNDYIWCFSVGPRGMECWRDGALIGRSVVYPSLDVSYAGSNPGAPKVCEGFWGSKPFIPGGPNYHSGMMQFKFLYTFERQLEEEEIMMYFNDPYGLIRPPAIWKPDKIGPLNNRIEVTTPIEFVAEVQEPGQSAIDDVLTRPVAVVAIPAIADEATEGAVDLETVDAVELIEAEVVAEVQEPANMAEDSVELTPAEVAISVEQPSQTVEDAVEPSPVEALMEVQEPGQSVADVIIAAVVEILAEVQAPGASEIAQVEPDPVETSVEVQSPANAVVDAVEPEPVVTSVEAQPPSQSAIDALATVAVEAIFETQAPDLAVSDGVTVEPVPVSFAMQVQPPSLTDLVTVITQAAEVVFGIARIDVSTEDDVFYVHKQYVHNAIVEALQQGIFLPVTYDPTTKLMSVPTDEEDAVPPSSLAANELTCLFGLPERNRRERIMERGTWRWQVIVKFDREVVLEVFEESLVAAPILVARDPSKSLRQITLQLIDAEYVHPPKQSPSSGTQVTYTFEARLGPV
jgi:hypothetical protein